MQHKSGVPPVSQSVRNNNGVDARAQKAPRGASNKTSSSQLPLSSIEQNNIEEEEEFIGMKKGVAGGTRANPFSQ